MRYPDMALECKWNVNFKSARKRERRIIIYAETETFGKQNGKLRGKITWSSLSMYLALTFLKCLNKIHSGPNVQVDVTRFYASTYLISKRQRRSCAILFQYIDQLIRNNLSNYLTNNWKESQLTLNNSRAVSIHDCGNLYQTIKNVFNSILNSKNLKTVYCMRLI